MWFAFVMYARAVDRRERTLTEEIVGERAGAKKVSEESGIANENEKR